MRAPSVFVAVAAVVVVVVVVKEPFDLRDARMCVCKLFDEVDVEG